MRKTSLRRMAVACSIGKPDSFQVDRTRALDRTQSGNYEEKRVVPEGKCLIFGCGRDALEGDSICGKHRAEYSLDNPVCGCGTELKQADAQRRGECNACFLVRDRSEAAQGVF